MRRYQFVVGVSLSALEEDLNRIVNDEHSANLNQVLYVQGTGFIGVVERAESTGVVRTERIEPPAEARTKMHKPRKTS